VLGICGTRESVTKMWVAIAEECSESNYCNGIQVWVQVTARGTIKCVEKVFLPLLAKQGALSD
jgi:hypothetical protein